MNKITPVSLERHTGRTWQRPADFLFAREDAICVLVGPEAPRAMLSMSIAFMAHADMHVPVAVLGHKQGQNLFVAQDGRWLVDYIPAVYRAFPFRLARSAEGNDVLCVDEAAGGVNESPSGEPFFNPDGSPAKLVAEAMNLLSRIEREHLATRNACALLVRHEVLEPWPLHYQDGDEVKAITGLLRVAEARLKALDGAALQELHESGALQLAYCQMWSMPQVHQMAKLRAASAPPPQMPSLGLVDNNGILDFDKL